MSDPHYQEETSINTDPAWLDEGRVEVQLDSMAAYADGMHQLFMYVGLHMMRPFQGIQASMEGAWDNGPFPLPEMIYVAQRAEVSANEFGQYMRSLAEGVDRVGMAAKNIADVYAGTDGFGAASLDAVRWALHDDGAVPPANVPSWISDQTAGERAAELARNAPVSEDSPGWSHGPIVSILGGTSQESTRPDGARMVVVTYSDAYGGPSTRTTTLYLPDGTVIVKVQTTEVTYADRKVVTRVSETVDGQSRGAEVTEQRYEDGRVAEQTVTNFDSNGDPTGQVKTETRADGSVRITNYGAKDGEINTDEPKRTIAIGADTPGADPAPVDPIPAATQDLADPWGTNELERRDQLPKFP